MASASLHLPAAANSRGSSFTSTHVHFPEVDLHSLPKNPHSLLPVLKSCTKNSSTSLGTQLHAFAIKCNAMADSYVANSLIAMYFACRRPHDARHLFDEMPVRTAVSWSCLIGGYAGVGEWDTVKSLFDTMVAELPGLPNSVALVRVVTACTKTRDFAFGQRVHRLIVEKEVPLCVHLGNALANMYVKAGDVEEAEMVFRGMLERDVVSWTTLVNGYASVGRVEKAQEAFDAMPSRNVVAWNAMIGGYVLNNCFEEAILLFSMMMENGIESDKATMVSILSACVRSGKAVRGKVIHGYIYKVGIDLTLDLLHSVLAVYTNCGDMDSAELLFDKLGSKSEISWTLMAVGYVKHGAVETAFQTFNQMPCKDTAAWNAMISTLAKNGYFSEALDVFQKMQTVKVTPNQLTLVGALTACARAGALETGRWIHEYIESIGIEMDTQLSSSLADMYAKCGCLELSLDVFNRIHSKDLLAWSTVINALAMHGKGELALDYFLQMESKGIQPDAITFLGVLAACSHTGLVEEGKRYYNLMTRKYGIIPSLEHCSCMVDLFGRCGLLDEAKDFIQTQGVSSDAIWRALLNSCKIHKNIQLAEYASSQLREMEQTHSGGYVLLSNVYAEASMWDDVEEMRTMMKRKGIEKIPGCSWIEVNGVIHEFFAGDALHQG